jgi:hypothetical protein
MAQVRRPASCEFGSQFVARVEFLHNLALDGCATLGAAFRSLPATTDDLEQSLALVLRYTWWLR